MKKNLPKPANHTFTNLKEEAVTNILESREKEVKGTSREENKTNHIQSLMNIREKAKNPCFKVQEEYV